MKKLFNLRFPVLYAALTASGILFSAALAFTGLDGIYILIPSIIIFSCCAIYGIFTKEPATAVKFVIAGVFFVVGALYAYLRYQAFVSDEALCGELVKVSGTVDESGKTSSGGVYIVLNGVSVNGKSISGRVIAYLSETAGDYCRKGYTAEFYSELSKESFISYGGIGYRAVDNIKYSCTVYGSLKAEYRFSLFGEMNNAVQTTLFDNLDRETAAVIYAMLTGDTGEISGGTLKAFRYGGIAHIFAVSGLHIGVIFGSLTAVFKKIGLNRFVSAVIRIVFIVLYAGMCNFSPSSVRAVTMCSVSAAASCLYRKYDMWNSLSLAAIILFMINPFYLFDAGFVLSFSAMLGITLISHSFKKALRFLPRKIKESLSVGFSAQIGTMPAMLVTFGYISAAGLILNLVFIPVISAVYVLLFVSTAVCAVIPALGGAVMPVVSAPLEFIINLVVSCGFEKSLISADVGVWFYIPCVFVIAAISDKCNLRMRYRCFVLFLTLVSVMITAASRVQAAPTVSFGSGYDGGYMRIKTDAGTVLVITDNYRGLSGATGEADSLVVLGDDGLSAVFNSEEVFSDAYMCGSGFPIPQVGPTTIHYADEFELYGISFRYEEDSLIVGMEGLSLSLVLKDAGDEYGDLNKDCAFELYCYEGERTVLFEGEKKSYAPDICGELEYTVKEGSYALCTAVPKE